MVLAWHIHLKKKKHTLNRAQILDVLVDEVRIALVTECVLVSS